MLSCLFDETKTFQSESEQLNYWTCFHLMLYDHMSHNTGRQFTGQLLRVVIHPNSSYTNYLHFGDLYENLALPLLDINSSDPSHYCMWKYWANWIVNQSLSSGSTGRATGRLPGGCGFDTRLPPSVSSKPSQMYHTSLMHQDWMQSIVNTNDRIWL